MIDSSTVTSADSAGRPAAASQDAFSFTVDALLIDMDGTLVDSTPAVVRAWNQGLAELGSDRTFTHDFHGVPARQSLRRVFPERSEEEIDAAFEHIEARELADVDGIEILPGTERLLAELDEIERELGRPVWTIVTSCTRRLFEARWATTGLPHPDGLVTADQVERGKPDPAPYLLGMRRLGVAGEQALVLEDSLGGLASGRDAGALTLAVTTTTPRESLAPVADAIVGTLDDVTVRAVDGRLEVARRAR
ncbi:HAD-IA family hydrolase [Brachybacterium nesterenkovii]|uniref:HAD-IA family hydrolase n=1 Tax=Brachybacterium nesterenkovii TaxID=47847 RepID=UPI003219B5B2